jgi:DNA-binding response OmpR family regulator
MLMVIDDNEQMRNMLARRLTRRGFTVATASDAMEGLQTVLREPVELVLLDHMMPGIDGLEALKLLRHKYSATALPVIMVTARRDADNMADALELGANDYVTKPVDFEALLEQIEYHLSQRQADAAPDNDALQVQVG